MPQTVDMFGPDGQVHEVQQSDMQTAMTSGGELAHQLKGPDGQIHYVRHSQLGEALKSGGVPVAAMPQADSSISAVHQPDTVSGKIAQWADNLSNDIKYGTDTTAIGAGLKKMGAKGAYSGNSQGVGDFMASMPLGVLRIIKGQNEGGLQGPKDIASGAVQASTMPGAFVAPEGAKAAAELIPSAKYAGKLFEQVKGVAGDLPVDISSTGNSALRTQELAENGGKMPTLINKFLKKATAPGTGDMDFNTARDFYSNAGQQSIMQKLTTSPVMKRQIAQFRGDLGGAIQYTADQAGVGDKYREALQEYHRAMVAKGISKAALVALGGALALKAGYSVLGPDAMKVVQGAAAGIP